MIAFYYSLSLQSKNNLNFRHFNPRKESSVFSLDQIVKGLENIYGRMASSESVLIHRQSPPDE